MKNRDIVIELAQCPKCGGKLEEDSNKGVRCQECEAHYPEIGNMIWLFEDPGFT